MNRFVQILKWTGITVVAFVALTAAVVYGLSEYELTRTYNDKVPLTAIAVPHDDASIAEGKRLVGVYHCGSCHAKDYEGQAFLKVDMLATLIAPNHQHTNLFGFGTGADCSPCGEKRRKQCLDVFVGNVHGHYRC